MMSIKDFFTDWKWDVFIGVINVLGFIGIKMDICSEHIKQASMQSVVEYVLLFVSMYFFVKAMVIGNKCPDVSKVVLKDIFNSTKDNKCALFSFRGYGNSGVPTEETWEVWLKKFPLSIGRPDLDYYNLGDEFYLVDYATGKEIEIPTGNKARTEKVGVTIRPGMVLRLMQKN